MHMHTHHSKKSYPFFKHTTPLALIRWLLLIRNHFLFDGKPHLGRDLYMERGGRWQLV